MSKPRQASRIRTVALLLSGVLPLAIQPSALAGQIAASRNVDRMVGDLPDPISIDELIRLLGGTGQDDAESSDADVVPSDVMAVIAQCRLMSLMSDSAALQAPDVEPTASGAAVACNETGLLPEPAVFETEYPVSPDRVVVARRLSDEQPLGP